MIGEKLRELRKQKGITADVLCAELEITVGSYRNYERNDRNPPYDTLIKIADYYDVSVDYLLGRNTQKEKPYHLGLEKGIKQAYLSLPQEVRAQILQAMLDAVMSYQGEMQSEENINGREKEVTTVGEELDRMEADRAVTDAEAKRTAEG